ncbi:MAG TPA: UbiD family decarboxylase [Syntrophales bacterium]|nr:UbiD family decarboxylase [Syntrophales bacterium]
MAVKSNRDFITKLEEAGELVRVKEQVDWDEEMSAIVRRICEIHGPAALFENVKDYPGSRCLGAPLAENRRFAVALGLNANISYQELRAVYAERMQKPIPPVEVKKAKAPCKENIIAEKDVDIFDFPSPMVHDGDGGRYVGTWAYQITKDPENNWVNYGIYRVMVYDEQHLAGLFTPSKHIGQQIEKYRKAGKKTVPVVIVVGGDPVSSLMASFDAPVGVNEIDCAGALSQKPIEVVKCEHSDLQVPAQSEIVIEGEVMLDVTVPEGPFGEFTGYRSGSGMRNLIKIKGITHRNDPIFTISNMGIPFHESSLRGLSRSLTYEKFFKSLGIPITNCHVPPEMSEMVLVVGVKTTHADMAVRVKNAFSAWRPSCMHKIIVVDEDVDVFNLNEVLHALATKCHPIRGIKAYEEHILHLVPALSAEERAKGKGAVALFDCTWPTEWPLEERPPRISFSTYPDDLVAKITKKWTKYGFKKV